jgi:hypothetical protein
VQQRLGMPEHDRVVVRVHDPRLRRDPLCDLMEVGFGGDARPDVQELAQAGLGGGAHGPVHEAPVGARPA